MKYAEDLEDEVWKKIPDSSYSISNKGRVKSPKNLIKPQLNKRTKLLQAMIYVNGKAKLLNIQAWVGRLFLPEPESPELVVRHKTSDFLNNCVENLEWGRQGVRREDIAKPRPKKRKFRYVIRQLTLKGFCIATYSNFEQLEEDGFKASQIKKAGKNKYCGGNRYKNYLWDVERFSNKK